jgi:MoxR-like ATPase
MQPVLQMIARVGPSDANVLITGEPGTGKTQLASSIAWELGLPLQEFYAKTGSSGADLFYRYDSLLRFHDAQDKEKKLEPTRYVAYSALGKAILFSHAPEKVKNFLPKEAIEEHKAATRSVVLIDEIDKAPRDFPNDILQEIERLAFSVKEAGWEPFQVDSDRRPIVILTSNLERNLPDAFLRRCVFYHIAFPDKKQLSEIVERRLKPKDSRQKELYDSGIDHFLEIRENPDLIKKPATAEMLAWFRILDRDGLEARDLRDARKVRAGYTVLLKTREDIDRLQQATTSASA